MTLNIVSKSPRGTVIVTDGLQTSLGSQHPATNTKKIFRLGPFCCATIAGCDGFVSKTSAKLKKPKVDIRFSDLHASLHAIHPELSKVHLAPDEITDQLRRHARRQIAINATRDRHSKISSQVKQNDHTDVLQTLIAGYDTDGTFNLQTLDLPHGRVKRYTNIRDHDLIVTGSGVNAYKYFLAILRQRGARTKLIDLIKTKIKDENLKNSFIKFIKRFSLENGLNFIHSFSLETQSKYLTVLAKLLIFIAQNTKSLFGNFEDQCSIGGQVKTSSFSPEKPLTLD